MAKLLGRLKGETTIGELAGKSGLGGYVFDAVVRAIVEYGSWLACVAWNARMVGSRI